MRLGVSDVAAQFLARRALTAHHRVLADPDVTLADQMAACLVAERVLLAAVLSLIALDAARKDTAGAAAPTQPPLAD